MLSVLIPSRNEPYLRHTVEDVLKNSEGEIEVIVILDGAPEREPLPDDPRIKVIRKEKPEGLRKGLNDAVAIAKGEFIMKLDAHCMVGKGFDRILAETCRPNWIVIPRRKRLEPYTWEVKDVGKVDVDYEYLDWSHDPNEWGGEGLHGKQWNDRSRERLGKPEYMIDDNMTAQGSAWFCPKAYYHELELMDEEGYGIFFNEAQEWGLKAWLSGGRVMVNKHTWYAHWHKGKPRPDRPSGRGYYIAKADLISGNHAINRWLTNSAWDKQTIDLSALVEYFWPVPGWTEEGLKKIKEHDKHHRKIEPWTP